MVSPSSFSARISLRASGLRYRYAVSSGPRFASLTLHMFAHFGIGKVATRPLFVGFGQI